MSHRDDCPDRWTARRAGKRDYENRGYRSYSDPYDCDEANRAYHDAQRSAQYEAEREAEYQESVRREHHRRQLLEQEWAEQEHAEMEGREQEREAAEYEEWYAKIEATTAEVWGDGP